MTEKKRIALVAGATGLVGGFLVRKLLISPAFDKVIAVTRRELNGHGRMIGTHPKLRQIIIPLDDMEGFPADANVKADDAFCALGTTIKRAGSQAAFRHVDFDHVVNFARAAKAAGAKRFFLVSAVGASAKSNIFYSRVKGETEEAVKAVGFQATHIFRPSMLLGERQESRPAEAVARALTPFINPLLLGGASIYRGINAETVARAMVGAAGTDMTGVHVHHHAGMMRLARG
ncbi:MAG: NAD(P)H-binding protein [Parvibaculum sp.]